MCGLLKKRKNLKFIYKRQWISLFSYCLRVVNLNEYPAYEQRLGILCFLYGATDCMAQVMKLDMEKTNKAFKLVIQSSFFFKNKAAGNAAYEHMMSEIPHSPYQEIVIEGGQTFRDWVAAKDPADKLYPAYRLQELLNNIK